MISALSVAFLPVVYRNCWIGWMACSSSCFFQEFKEGVVQSPWMRLTVAVL